MEHVTGDLTIAGTGTVGGGTFHAVKVGGVGDINGDLECALLTVGGVITADGHVKTENAKIGGTATFRGNLAGGTVKVGGTVDVGGTVEVKKFEIYGAATVKGSVQAEEVELKGSLMIGGDCSAEDFSSRGAFTIQGMLNAGSIEIGLHGKSEAKEIGGERIRVRRDRESKLEELISWIFPHSGALSAETIEGDDVQLEYTMARVVRGKRVSIGPGCEIDLVEYQEELRKAEGTKIKEEKRI